MENFVNPHMEKWASYIKKMSEAMSNNDIEESDKYSELANKEYSAYKEYADGMWSCSNFGSCNESIQQSLSTLMKEKTKALKEIMNIIKEDSNLSAQLKFHNALINCNTNNTFEYINEAINVVSPQINLKTIKESNEKLINALRRNNICPKTKFTDEQIKLFENCDYLMSHKKSIKNLNTYTNKLSEICEHVKTNVVPVNENKHNVYSLIEDYEKKYCNILNEEEKSFVKEILNASKDGKTAKKNKFFESLKQDCIDGLNKLLETASENEKSSIISIKEEISNKTFNEDSLVADVAKLLEIRDVILEK